MFSSSCIEVLFLILNKLSVCTLVYAMVYTTYILYCSQLKMSYCQFGRRFIIVVHVKLWCQLCSVNLEF